MSEKPFARAERARIGRAAQAAIVAKARAEMDAVPVPPSPEPVVPVSALRALLAQYREQADDNLYTDAGQWAFKNAADDLAALIRKHAPEAEES